MSGDPQGWVWFGPGPSVMCAPNPWAEAQAVARVFGGAAALTGPAPHALSDADVDRIARRAVGLLREAKP